MTVDELSSRRKVIVPCGKVQMGTPEDKGVGGVLFELYQAPSS